MNDVKTARLTGPNSGLIKPATPAEKAREKIHMLREKNYNAERTERIRRRVSKDKQKTIKYVVGYLIWHYSLSIAQIRNLGEEDFNNLPEVILAEKKAKVILLGWFPLFGWIYAIKYIWFKRRIKFLKSCNENIFYESAKTDIGRWLNLPPENCVRF